MNSIEKIGKYLREISVVVIGVAITLFASFWITDRNEKREMSLHLAAIKLELEENLSMLDATNHYLIQPAVKYANFLRSHDKKSLNLDSLRYYVNSGTIYNASSITIKTNAFDMFKTSGNMRLVTNKELLLSIWDSYAILVEAKSNFDKHSEMKMEEMKKYFFNYGNNPSDEAILKYPPLYEIYLNLPIPLMQARDYERIRALLVETISMFDRKID
jgi:hypothetical protein